MGEKTIDIELNGAKIATAAPLCPVDRMPSRRRNRICLRIIIIGALNFLAFTIVYAAIGGDAPNGSRELLQEPDGTARPAYYVRGHFIRSLDGRQREVSKALWIYSYLHSITLPLTSGAMIVSMLILARPHILATMRDGRIQGSTFVTAFATVVILISAGAAFLFTWDFIAAMTAA